MKLSTQDWGGVNNSPPRLPMHIPLKAAELHPPLSQTTPEAFLFMCSGPLCSRTVLLSVTANPLRGDRSSLWMNVEVAVRKEN